MNRAHIKTQYEAMLINDRLFAICIIDKVYKIRKKNYSVVAVAELEQKQLKFLSKQLDFL